VINDQTSGVGAILEKSRLQGVLKGTSTGGVMLERVMNDEQVADGDMVLTSGGDGIFPKGLPVGTVTRVEPGKELFLNITVRPAASLSRLEEVLVVTQKEERQVMAAGSGRVRAVDIMAQRLPSVPDKPETTAPGATPTSGQSPATLQSQGSAAPAKTQVASPGATALKPATAKPVVVPVSKPAANPVQQQAQPPASTPAPAPGDTPQ